MALIAFPCQPNSTRSFEKYRRICEFIENRQKNILLSMIFVEDRPPVPIDLIYNRTGCCNIVLLGVDFDAFLCSKQLEQIKRKSMCIVHFKCGFSCQRLTRQLTFTLSSLNNSILVCAKEISLDRLFRQNNIFEIS